MRVKGGKVTRRRHNKILKMAEGFRGRRKSCFKIAKIAVQKSLKFAYRDRRAKKREYRNLWIIRINAAARLNGLSYSKLMYGLKKANIEIDRKILADLAYSDMDSFKQIAEQARAAL